MKLFFLFLFSLLLLPVFSHANNEVSEKQFELGVTAGKNGNLAEELEWYLKAAEQGHIMAQHNLGEMYFFAQGVEQNTDKALEWYLKAAEQGDVVSQFKVARIYYPKSDFEKSFEWYLKAAEQGHAKAQEMVASHYFTGMGVDRDMEEGKKWLRKSAEQGNKDAIESLRIFNSGPEEQ